MENQDSSPKTLIETAEEYVRTKGKLIKLQVVQTISDTTSSLVSGFILLLIVNMALLFLSVGIAGWIRSCTGKMYYGFLIVGGFYMLAAIIIVSFRNKLLKQP